MVHGFAQQAASHKHAYTIQFAAFVLYTLHMRNISSIKVQQLQSSSCTQTGVRFAVVLLQSGTIVVERILAAATQYLDANSLVCIQQSR